MRSGFVATYEDPAGWNPARSAMRSVDWSVYRHTEPSAANGAATRFVVVTPARGLRLDAVGCGLSHANAVTYPFALFTAVRFSSTLVALLGTPATPAPAICTLTTAPAAGLVALRVSSTRVGVVETSSGARGGCAGPRFTAATLGSATYGNVELNARSLRSTRSPLAKGATLPLTAAPSTACTAMSRTSSASRRPLGKPWKSPPSTPRRLGLAVTGVLMLRRSISDGRKFAGFTSSFTSCELRSAWIGPFAPLSAAMPVRKISNRSLRGVGGAGMP